jgi:hypothetical protein
MAYLSACGVDIGELNHSKEFLQRLTNSFQKILTNHTEAALAAPLPATVQPDPVAVTADKVTLNHRTYQIVGISTPIKGGMTTVYVGISPAQSHVATGLPDDLEVKIGTHMLKH